MRDMIAEAAKANGRSMNAEIVTRLGDSFSSITLVPTLGEPSSRMLDIIERQAEEMEAILTLMKSSVGADRFAKTLARIRRHREKAILQTLGGFVGWPAKSRATKTAPPQKINRPWAVN